MAVGTASESLNEWADEEAGLEAVQRVLDSLDDIHALQDSFVDQDVLLDMLRDVKLHALLQVTETFKKKKLNKYLKIVFSFMTVLVVRLCRHRERLLEMQYFVVVTR